MTMINALFYLLLLLSALAVVRILADLDRAEKSALRELALTDAEPAPERPACHPVRVPAFITLSAFPGCPAGFEAMRPGRAPDAAPNYDFALASAPRPAPAAAATAKKGQAVSDLPPAAASRDWNCCA